MHWLAAAASAAIAAAGVSQPAFGQDPGVDQGRAGLSSSMLIELQQMHEELRELRGMVEAQAREIENLKRRQRDQYIDLDRRLSELAGSGAAPAASGGAGNQVGAPTESRERNEQVPQPGVRASEPQVRAEPSDGVPARDLPEVRSPIEPEAEIVTLADPGSGGERRLREPTEAERQAYDQAFLALRETRYADAAEGFDRFLRDHPDSSYSPNAMYWLGEVYYVTRDFETALRQFQRLQEKYPDSSKKPDALLKTGFAHYELGQWERARAALEQVIAEYPGTNYSRLAENRLRTMRLEGHL
ncbi:MAG: tol-pal system protein YbgF [Wenzhouxiangellaceae bacterium]|nr:tol-pal system protein YbgF [Wenzhouxiangellaceae bacterium]